MLKICGQKRRRYTPLLLGALVMLVSACDSATPRPAQQAEPAKQSKEQESVTFYLPGMNEELKIL